MRTGLALCVSLLFCLTICGHEIIHTDGVQMDLTKKQCKACEGCVDPLSVEDENKYCQLIPQWHIDRDGVHTLTRLFQFKHFKDAMQFINAVANIAEHEQHHPNIYLFSYNKVRIDLYTHALKGLSENDFIVAARIDQI